MGPSTPCRLPSDWTRGIPRTCGGKSPCVEGAWVPEGVCGRLSSPECEQELNSHCVKPPRFQGLSNLAGDKALVHSGSDKENVVTGGWGRREGRWEAFLVEPPSPSLPLSPICTSSCPLPPPALQLGHSIPNKGSRPQTQLLAGGAENCLLWSHPVAGHTQWPEVPAAPARATG